MNYQHYYQVLRAFLGVHTGRLRVARREGDAGASAVELAIITALMLVVAIGVVAAITTFTGNANNKIANTNP
jgi:Flp pilus assembly protein TadG